jgi:hypothetical protein
MKVNIKHGTVQKASPLVAPKKSSIFSRTPDPPKHEFEHLSVKVEYSPEEREIMDRGGLHYLLLCDLPRQAFYVRFPPPEDIFSAPQDDFTALPAGYFNHNELSWTFNHLLNARGAAEDIVAGLRKLKEHIERDQARPFLAEITLEI